MLDLSKYDTDKITNRFLERYEPIFLPLATQDLRLLELGVFRGGSVLLWHDYFPKALIAGIDLKLPEEWKPQERIRLFQGGQADTALLDRVSQEVAPNGFDIIIDDASHFGDLTRIAFWHLFTHHLKSGGIYVIEDWGTGYWSDWHDGEEVSRPTRLQLKLSRFLQKLRIIPNDGPPSHAFGMVGFVKELVDEVGAGASSRRVNRGLATRTSRFSQVIIKPGIVFVFKE